MIGVGLIGTGYMGKCHAIAWSGVRAVFGDVPEIRLVHLGETDQARAEQRAGELGFARASGDWRRVVEDPDVSVVSVTTPNQFHAEMAIVALQAGKHVWCEKPMATSFADAERMATAASASGKVTALGYNYIQSPAIRLIERMLRERRIGRVNHLRIEMDEDFMADPHAPFGPKHDRASGYGALDDFGVHPLSLISKLFGRVESVMCDMSRPVAERRDGAGTLRPVETFDLASCLLKLENGVSATLALDRAAWGRKGRIQMQIFGAAGSIVFDQERFNEIKLYLSRDDPAEQGFRTILAGPAHEPYGHFIPAPGHGLGFNDLKVIEAHELIRRMNGGDARLIDFGEGLEIERTVHAMARSHEARRWVEVR
ncbi:MAG: Gfo/Idh/MocA family oxidoreductase [Methylobacterium mesophilicum]|nr:Gfo/Idh/MocA family oxidoreductase [Methylobacterium mesophilicum]